MINKYKIDDWIVFIDKEISNKLKNEIGFSLYGKIGKIIDKYNSMYLVDLGYRKGENGYCIWYSAKFIILYKDYFKLKKLMQL